MKNEWLTTLLKQKGLSISSSDLTSLLEELSPKLRNGAMGRVFDWFRPFSAGMGLRVARLGDQHVELVLPYQTHNLSSEGYLHEGALFSAGSEAVRILWERHAPYGEFLILFKKSQFELRQLTKEDVRVRFELIEASRETILSSLRRHRIGIAEAAVSYFNEKDQLIGELNLSYEIHHTPNLEKSKA